jgi:hypothetical protein
MSGSFSLIVSLLLFWLPNETSALRFLAAKRSSLTMSLEGKSSFLIDKDQNIYLTNILRRAVASTNQCLEEGKTLIEIEFPANRKSDLSLGETQDTNREFVFQYVKQFSKFEKDLWVVMPDKRETFLARSKWGEELPFTLTSIEGLLQAKPALVPKLLVFVNPGFNIAEWIDIPKVVEQAGNPPVVIINGYLDRLRNGYYPAIFYPGLTKVSKGFYSTATQACFLSPIAVGGNRLGAWLARVYPGPWEVLVRNKEGYEVIQTSDQEPKGQQAWNLAKKAFFEINGGGLL